MTDSEAFLNIRLNARLQPMHRHELFEDPLIEAFEKSGAAEVDGGGTEQTKSGEVAYCEIGVVAKSASKELVSTIVSILEECGAPKGSRITSEALSAPVDFGTEEGLALYLNGRELPDEVYSEYDVNEVIAELDGALGDAGRLTSWFEGAKETGLYFYGDSFGAMAEAMLPIINSNPLCALSRVEQIA